jgi:hypothetical protein
VVCKLIQEYVDLFLLASYQQHLQHHNSTQQQLFVTTTPNWQPLPKSPIGMISIRSHSWLLACFVSNSKVCPILPFSVLLFSHPLAAVCTLVWICQQWFDWWLCLLQVAHPTPTRHCLDLVPLHRSYHHYHFPIRNKFCLDSHYHSYGLFYWSYSFM